MKSSPPLVLHPEVAEAVRSGRPVVALESTLIAHGLPWPTNLETARAAEDAVRAAGAAVPDLIKDIKKNSGAGRVLAVELLAQIGVEDKEKLAALEELMVDPDFSVRMHSVRMIGKKNPNHKTVVTVLIEGLQSKEAYQRKMAAETLETVHPTDDAVLEVLAAATKDRDPGVRQAAGRALKKLKAKTP